MSRQNGTVLDRLNEEVFKQANIDALDELLADDFVEHNPPPGMGSDRDGFKDFIRDVHQAFDDQVYTVKDQIVEGDRVVERWDLTATHVAEWMGIAPTGKRITLTGIDISRLKDGRIVEHWTQCDMLGLLQQLGVIPAEEAAAG